MLLPLPPYIIANKKKVVNWARNAIVLAWLALHCKEEGGMDVHVHVHVQCRYMIIM